MTVSLHNKFAEALAGHDAFSAEALEKAKFCLLDFLACALSTAHFSWVQQAQTVARNNSETATGGSPVIGTPYRVSVQDAAFANAVAGHSLVRDDMHVGSVSHLGVVVVPTALALAEQEQITGRQLLEAVICGYEAGAVLGSMLMDVETAKKFRPTGLIGAFASAATGARLCGLDIAQTASALGFAANYITGLNEWAGWGSDDMYFHPGIAARNGITAMLLARQGARSAAGSLDGIAGLFAALGKAVPETPDQPFNREEEILRVFFKQVPACNYAQTAAQVALKTGRQFNLHAETIDQVKVLVPHAAAHYPGCDYKGPFNSILQARMSIYFNVAATLLHGNFDDENYHDFGNAGIAALIEKIEVIVDEILTTNYPLQQGAGITIRTTDGGIFSETLEDVIPASVEEVTSRFRAAAVAGLGEFQAQSLLERVMKLEQSRETGGILALLCPP